MTTDGVGEGAVVVAAAAVVAAAVVVVVGKTAAVTVGAPVQLP